MKISEISRRSQVEKKGGKTGFPAKKNDENDPCVLGEGEIFARGEVTHQRHDPYLDFHEKAFGFFHGKAIYLNQFDHFGRRSKMKAWFRYLVVILMFSAFLTGVAGESLSQEITYSGPPITLRFSNHSAATHPLYKTNWYPFIELVKKESKGKLLFTVYAAGNLHGPRDGFKACVNNITDWTMGYPSWQAGSFNLTHVIEMPFAFANEYVAAKVAEELYPKYFKKEYENLGVYLGDFHTTSPTHILTKKPVRKLEDLKGMKIRTSGGVTSEILKRLGGVPVFLPSPEVYTSFQRGVLDGVLTTKQDQAAWRTHEIGKFITLMGAYTIPVPTILNRKTFDGLPKDLKTMFYNKLRQFNQIAPAGYNANDQEAMETFKKAGVEIITLTPAEFERGKKLVEPLWEEFATKNAALGGKKLVEDLRALNQKYASWTPEQLMKEVMNNPIHGIVDGM